jgi:hypothetical protein
VATTDHCQFQGAFACSPIMACASISRTASPSAGVGIWISWGCVRGMAGRNPLHSAPCDHAQRSTPPRLGLHRLHMCMPRLPMDVRRCRTGGTVTNHRAGIVPGPEQKFSSATAATSVPGTNWKSTAGTSFHRGRPVHGCGPQCRLAYRLGLGPQTLPPRKAFLNYIGKLVERDAFRRGVAQDEVLITQAAAARAASPSCLHAPAENTVSRKAAPGAC